MSCGDCVLSHIHAMAAYHHALVGKPYYHCCIVSYRCLPSVIKLLFIPRVCEDQFNRQTTKLVPHLLSLIRTEQKYVS